MSRVLDPELAARLTTRASLGSSPSTPVHVDEARWVLGRELPEPPDAVCGWAPWSSWVAGLGAVASSGPITTWRMVAAVLGIDEDTLSRYRRLHGDPTRGRPWFAGAAEVRSWWSDLRSYRPEPPPSPELATRTRSSPQRESGKGVTRADIRKAIAKLTGP